MPFVLLTLFSVHEHAAPGVALLMHISASVVPTLSTFSEVHCAGIGLLLTLTVIVLIAAGLVEVASAP